MSLRVRNFRLFITGQAISLCGTWMQTIGLSWLAWTLTHSGTQLGLIVAAQFLPILLFGTWGGVIADRFNKRHTLYFTQSVFGMLALLLGVLVLVHLTPIWVLYVLSIAFGFVNVIDNPTRQAFVIEMVGSDNVKNAVTLNSTMVNGARVIGPSMAGILIATAGVGVCFIANALSYIAVLIALRAMQAKELYPAPKASKKAGQVMEGLKYVWYEPTLKATLIMMFIVGTFAYEFPVIFPLFATGVLHGDASTYSAMMIATGIGAIGGGLYTASHAASHRNELVWTACLFGISIMVAAFMPSYWSVMITLVVVGALSVLFVALGNTTLQLTSSPSMRGRVMSLWAIAFLGTTPIGGPIVGFISSRTNPRIGLALGGLSAIIAALVGLYIYTSAKHPVELLPVPDADN